MLSTQSVVCAGQALYPLLSCGLIRNPNFDSTWYAQPSIRGLWVVVCRVHSKDLENRVASASDLSWGQLQVLDPLTTLPLLFQHPHGFILKCTVCVSTVSLQPVRSLGVLFHGYSFSEWHCSHMHSFHWLHQVTWYLCDSLLIYPSVPPGCTSVFLCYLWQGTAWGRCTDKSHVCCNPSSPRHSTQQPFILKTGKSGLNVFSCCVYSPLPWFFSTDD